MSEEELQALRAEKVVLQKRIFDLENELAAVADTVKAANDRAEREIADRQAEHEHLEFLMGRSSGPPPPGLTEDHRGYLSDEMLRNRGQVPLSDAHILYADRVLDNMRKRINTKRKAHGLKEV